MMIEFFQGMILGFTVAVPLGPINLLMMNESLKSYKNGLFVGLGAMSADMTFLMTILFGLSAYFENPWVYKSLSLFGALFLLYMARNLYKNAKEPVKNVDTGIHGSLKKHYAKGYILTLFSPYTLMFWLSVATMSIGKTSPLLIILGMFTALLMWIGLMPYFVYRTKHLISSALYSKMAVVSAVVFSLFSFGMIIRLFN